MIPRNKLLVIILMIFIIILISGGLLFLYNNNPKQSKSAGIAGGDVDSIINHIERLVEFPTSEKPSQIANISDISKLSNNPFFTNAKNGDIVLIYEKNKMAVLFRPQTGKIIAIGPLSDSERIPKANPISTSTATPSATIKPKVDP